MKKVIITKGFNTIVNQTTKDNVIFKIEVEQGTKKGSFNSFVKLQGLHLSIAVNNFLSTLKEDKKKEVETDKKETPEIKKEVSKK